MHKTLLTGLIVVSAITQVTLSDQARATPLIADLRGGTDGSCNGSAFSSPSGQFSSGDIGKVLVVSGDASGTAPAAAAAINNAPLFTTVVAVSSTTAITLSAACASAMTGITSAQWHVGTNNTVALQDCLDTGLCSVP